MDNNNRYARNIILPEIGKNGQKKLNHAKILVIGAGGLGAPALLYLAAAGIGNIGIVDNDIVAISNLQRQILYDEYFIGRPKVEVAEEKLKELNSEITTKTYKQYFSKECMHILTEYDLVLDCTDNHKSRFVINQACVKYNKPLVYGAAMGWQGQVATLTGQPCLQCFYEEPALATIDTCERNGILGAVTGIIGSMQAQEAIKYILGIKQAEELIIYNGLDNSFKKLKLVRDQQCSVCKNQP